MNKLFSFSAVLVSFCLIYVSETSAQSSILPWANINEFINALRNFNLFSIPPLDVANPAFQEYSIISNLFRNRPTARRPAICATCDRNAVCVRRGNAVGCVCNRFFTGNGQVCVFVPGPSGAEPTGGCPGGRVFMRCFRCDIPCSQRNGPGCPNAPCRRFCGCPPNYFVNDEGICVPARECGLAGPTQVQVGGEVCPGGRVFSSCARCDLLCSERSNPPPCTDRCRPGCSCPNNYYLNAVGDCVAANRCGAAPLRPTTRPTPSQQACPRGRDYTSCARCDLMCSERSNPPPCFDRCRPGCSCPNNYYLNDVGDCVTEDGCPAVIARTVLQPSPTPECRGNRRYSTCTMCDIPCTQRFNPSACTLDCRQGCACQRNYFINSQGVCVRAAQCPRPSTPRYVSTTTPYVATTTPYVPTRTSYISTTSPYVSTTRPYVPTTTPYEPTTSTALPEPTTTTIVVPTGNGGTDTPVCPQNQQYFSCLRCIYTCEDRNTFTPDQCQAPCQPGCRCPDNYYLYTDGRCLTSTECAIAAGEVIVTDAPTTTEPPVPPLTTTTSTTTETTEQSTEPPNLCRESCSNGVCILDSFGNFFCRCLPGFRGEFCQVRTRPPRLPLFFSRSCVPPCEENEVCVYVNTVDGYRCQ